MLDCLREPATDDQGAERTGLEGNSYRPRRDRLVKDGLVVRVGTGKSAKGNAASVWQAVASVSHNPRPGDGAGPLWEQLFQHKPDWMTKRHLEHLLREAATANGGNTAAAIRQVLRDLEALR